MNQPVSSFLALSTLVTADDDGAAIRSLEFFAENIPDPHVRRAYGYGRFAPIAGVARISASSQQRTLRWKGGQTEVVKGYRMPAEHRR